MPAAEFPPDVAGLLSRLRDRLVGHAVTRGRRRRLVRARRVRSIMQKGLARLSRLDPSATRPES